jgi:integrase
MARKKISAISLSTMPAGTYADHIVPGLLFIVGKNRRTWAYRYRSGGKRPKLKLGYYPQLGLAEARGAARKASERIDSGVAPAEPAPHPRSAAAVTLGTLLDRYEAMRTREGQRIKALPKAMRAMRLHLKPFLALPADEFSKADLRTVRDRLIEADTATAANRLLASLGPVMRWAAEEDLIPANIVPTVRRTAERKRDRVLTKKEIAAIWKGCDRLGPHEVAKNYGRLVKFLLLTAQRRDEAASLRHGHILDGIWRQTENKADRPHNIPLPPLALALVGTGDAREYVFGGRLSKIAAFSKWKTLLDKASGVTDWRLHDLRRTAASNMQELGVPNHIVQACLNHSIPGVGQVYLRGELEKQKRESLETWATAVTRIIGPARAVS